MKDILRTAWRDITRAVRTFLSNDRGGFARIIDGVIIAVLAAALGKLLGLG